MRQIHWKWIVVAGFLAEAAVMAVFFLLLFAATVAGVPEIARPMGTLDYVDALVSSFAMVFLFTLWVGKRIDSAFVTHGVLIGVLGILLFGILWLATVGWRPQPPLYVIAHCLKVLGGIAGGLVAGKRRRYVWIIPGPDGAENTPGLMPNPVVASTISPQIEVDRGRVR
jgi:hypothetical protein